MDERERARRDDGETNSRDIRGDWGAGGGRASDDEGSAPRYEDAAMDDDRELAPTGSRRLLSHAAAADAYPNQNESVPPGYPRSARSAPRAPRFRDDPSRDFDDPTPAKPRRMGAVGFFLLMAMIGASAGGLWFYFDPDLFGSSNVKVDRATEFLIRLVDEQTKLTQSVTAVQAAQDALQKSIAAREQELQRLLAETQALRADVNALRTGLADPAARAKSAPAAAKKKNPERKPAPQHEQPQNPSPPAAPTPSQ